MGDNIEWQGLVETNESGRDQSSRDWEGVKRSKQCVLTKNKKETARVKEYYTINVQRNKSKGAGRIQPRSEDSPPKLRGLLNRKIE